LNWVRPGPTILGWVGAASPLNSGLLHCSHATWTVEKKTQKKKEEEEEVKEEREDGLPAMAHDASSNCGGGVDGGGALSLRWLVVLLFLLSLPPLFFSAVFFLSFSFLFSSSFLLYPPLFCSILLFSFHFCSLPPSPFFSSLPRRERSGRPLCCRPSNTWKVFLGKWGWSASFWTRWRWKTEEEKIFFLPCFERPGEEEDPQCRSKRHRFGLFFLMNCVWNGVVLDKTRRFI